MTAVERVYTLRPQKNGSHYAKISANFIASWILASQKSVRLTFPYVWPVCCSSQAVGVEVAGDRVHSHHLKLGINNGLPSSQNCGKAGSTGPGWAPGTTTGPVTLRNFLLTPGKLPKPASAPCQDPAPCTTVCAPRRSLLWDHAITDSASHLGRAAGFRFPCCEVTPIIRI